MIFKKFIGALTVLVMTMTAFVGLATEVGAFSTNEPGSFDSLLLSLDGAPATTVYPNSSEEYNHLLTPGYCFTHPANEKLYIVNSIGAQFNNGVQIVSNALSASRFDITVNAGGSITINNGYSNFYFDSNSTNQSCVAATESEISITIDADDNSYIEWVSYDNGETNHPVPAENRKQYTTSVNVDSLTHLVVKFSTVYSITVSESIENGTVDVIPESAEEDEKITVYAIPDEGYELTSIEFSISADEVEAPIVTIANNRATFAMPASNITITPIFSEIETLPSSIAATCIGNFTEEGSQPASAWAGTLESVGNTSFKPSIYVTSNGTTKNVIGTTTVTGNSAIYIAVVVNEAQENVSVRLSGVPSSTQSSTIDGSYEDRSNSNEEVD